MTRKEGFLETSALLGIIKNEPERQEFLARLRARPHATSDMVRVEAAMALGAMFHSCATALVEIDAFLHEWRIGTLLLDEEVVRRCVLARDRYGKGSGHRAKLNMGDCYSYAFAARYHLDLLYKGDDFIHTDLG